MKLFLIFGLFLVTLASGQELIDENSECLNCALTAGKKICQGYNDPGQRFCCDEDDFSVDWGGVDGRKCSNEIIDDPTSNSNLLMWDNHNWWDHLSFYSYISDYSLVEEVNLPIASPCIMRVHGLISDGSQVEFKEAETDGLFANLFVRDNTNELHYSHEGTLTTYEYSRLAMPVEEDENVYIVIQPFNEENRISFKHQLIWHAISTATIIIIVAASFVLFIILTTIILVCKKKCRKSPTPVSYPVTHPAPMTHQPAPYPQNHPQNYQNDQNTPNNPNTQYPQPGQAYPAQAQTQYQPLLSQDQNPGINYADRVDQ